MSETPRPWEFPVGSLQSRAASRMLAQRKIEECERIEFVTNVDFHFGGPTGDRSKPYATSWAGTLDKGLMRMLYVPNGMSIEEAHRIMDRSSE